MEQFRPVPEGEHKPKAPDVREVRAGRLGKPPPAEQQPQGGAARVQGLIYPRQAEEVPRAHGGRKSPIVQQPEQESPFSKESYLREMRAIYEKDPNLFAARAMEALEALVRKRIPEVEAAVESAIQEARTRYDALGGGPIDSIRVMADGKLRNLGHNKIRLDGRIFGIEDAFNLIKRYITEERTEEPKK